MLDNSDDVQVQTEIRIYYANKKRLVYVAAKQQRIKFKKLYFVDGKIIEKIVTVVDMLIKDGILFHKTDESEEYIQTTLFDLDKFYVSIVETWEN